MEKQKTKTLDMTQGSLWKNIFLFSMPLVLAQLLEVMFNLSDVAVVGQFADYRALGAVGSTTILVTLFTGFLIGMGSGVNVQVALGLGAKDDKTVEKTIHTAFLICAAIGIMIGVFCILFARPMLQALHTKSDLIDAAVLYLKIYALGMPAMAVYNFGNGVLSAKGDTKSPLIYLAVAGVLNIILNLIFVIGFHLAAAGVAIASAIAQYVSMLLVMHNLLKRRDVCRLQISKIQFHQDVAKGILLMGIPTGMQNAIFALANLFVQRGVNYFYTIMVSGNVAATNADAIIFNVMSAFYTGCASFVSQNRGAGNRERMKKSYLVALIYSFLIGLFLGACLFFGGRYFLRAFATDRAVIDAGMERIKIMAFAYSISAFMDCTIAASRGLGKSIGPMIIVMLGSCVFRIIWVYTIFAHFHTIPSLYLLYPFSWTLTAIAEIAYFIVQFRKVMPKSRI